ncbi:MAG: Ig-like domain-containing protein, partial [Lachnospiraceae bacterium]|nr:Ig-like domain-containing protein [Lachnospiraceae bacterium]
ASMKDGVLEVGDSKVLSASIAPSVSDDEITWSVGNQDILEYQISKDNATISIKGKGSGISSIKASTPNVSAIYLLNVQYKKISSIQIADEKGDRLTSLSGKGGDRVQLKALTQPVGASEEVKWASDDESVCTISSDGVLVFTGSGGARNATVTAMAADGTGITGKLSVNIQPSPQSIHLSMGSISLVKGASKSITANVLPADATDLSLSGTPVYSKAGVAVASLTPLADAFGKTVSYQVTVSGLSVGKTQVTFSAGGNKNVTAVLDVYVNASGSSVPLKTLELDSKTLSLQIGASRKLLPQLLPANYSDTELVWQSSDESAVLVDSEGTLYAKGLGKSIITLTGTSYDADGRMLSVLKDTCQVSVLAKQAAERIKVSESEIVLRAPLAGNDGESKTVYYTVEPADTADKLVSWSLKEGSGEEKPSLSLTQVSGNGLQIKAIGSVSGTIIGTVMDESKKTSVEIHVTIENEIDEKDKELYLQNGYQEAKDGTVSPRLWIGNLEYTNGNKDGYIYTGSPIKPNPRVYCGTALLTKGEDYTLSYANNINVSDDARITVSSKGLYSGKETFPFSITKAAIDDPNNGSECFTISGLKAKARNKVQKLAPIVTFNGKILGKNEYKVSYPDQGTGVYQNVGTYIVKIDFTNNKNFSGIYEAQEYIVKDAQTRLSSLKIVVKNGKSLTYNGKNQEPDFTILSKNFGIFSKTEGTSSDENFGWFYSANSAAGNGKLTVYAKDDGDYIGSKTVTFKINKKKLTDTDISITINGEKNAYKATIPYLKGGATAKIKVYMGEEELEEGKDFKVSYSYKNANRVPKALVGIKVTGQGNYTGTMAFNELSTANSDLSEMTIVAEDFVYSKTPGAYQKAKVTIYDKDGTSLKAGLDYDKNISFSAESFAPSVGSVVNVSVRGIGKYAGSGKESNPVLTGSFRIINN